MNNTKICTRCKRELEATKENFSGDKSKKDGLRYMCKQCEKKEHKYYLNNNKIKTIEYNREYYLNNKDDKLIRKHKRKAIMKKLKHDFTEKEWNECKDYFKNEKGEYCCAYCSDKTTNLTQDHLIPVSKNGEYTKNNIIPVCKSCNSSKCDNDFIEWYEQQEFYNEENKNKILNYCCYN